MKFVLTLVLITILAVAAGRPKYAGSIHKGEGADLKKPGESLTNSLSKLAAGVDPYYKRVKTHDAYNLGTDVLALSKDATSYKSIKAEDVYDSEIVGLKEIISVDLKDKPCKYYSCDY